MKMKMTMVKLLVTAFTGIAAISCSSDEFFGFEEWNIAEEKNIDEADYLESIAKYRDSFRIDSQNRDLVIDAIKKIGVNKRNGYYVLTCSSGSEAGISEYLYSAISRRFEYTNFLLRTSKRKIPIQKTRNPENQGVYNDCFMVALSHYGDDVPSYETICNYCYTIQSNWPSVGLYLSHMMGVFYHFGISVIGVGYLTYSTHLDNAVVVISNPLIDHAVNGITYLYSDTYNDYIDYYDYKYDCSGFVCVSDVEELFCHP